MGITLTVGEQEVSLAVQAADVTLSTYIPGPQGDTGPAGPPGGAGFNIPTNSAIGGNRAIGLSGGYATYAETVRAIGISSTAVASGVDVTLISAGEMTIPGASFTVDEPVFLAANGTLSSTAPSTGLSQILGVANSATSLIINIQQPLFL